MKTSNLIIAAFAISTLFMGSAQAQSEESVFTNGKEVFLHKNSSALLKSLFARNVDGKIYLAWVAENLKNDGSFIIYRSSDGENFEIIGVQPAVKESDGEGMGYYFIDNSPIESAPSYYKIMHLDTDNAFFVSNRIAVKSQVADRTEGTR